MKEFMSCFQSHHCEVFSTWVFVCHCVNTVNTRLIPVKPTRLNNNNSNSNNNNNNNNNNNGNNNKLKLNNILIIVVIIMIIKLVTSLKRVDALFAVTSPFVWLCNK